MTDVRFGARGAVPPALVSRVAGCLLGGAVGDALGAPVEFDTLDAIRRRHGRAGVTGFVAGYWPAGSITDDTQMTLFTAEGLLRAVARQRERGIAHAPSVVWRAYQRWLATQGEALPNPVEGLLDGWLLQQQVLHARRAPGLTCLSALANGTPGSTGEPLNDSKGCGGVMRVAPVGLLADDAFDVAADVAALTHGHPSGFLSAAFFAETIAAILDGCSLPAALDRAERRLVSADDHREVLDAVRAARALAARGAPRAEAVESLGGGWTGEEALAIALYCALVAESFRHGVLLAVNHSGDSDSTGALTGNLLGALWGVEAIPAEWSRGVEAREVIEQIAVALYEARTTGAVDEERFPAH